MVAMYHSVSKTTTGEKNGRFAQFPPKMGGMRKYIHIQKCINNKEKQSSIKFRLKGGKNGNVRAAALFS